MPPAARPVPVRVQPATLVVAARTEQERNATGIFNGVHNNDPPKAHPFDFFVRELLTDETGQLGVGLRELAIVGLGANLLRGPIVASKEHHALENGDFGRYAAGRLEVRRAEEYLGVVTHTEALVFQTIDPFLTGYAVGSDREVDDTSFFPPGGGELDRSNVWHERLPELTTKLPLITVPFLHVLIHEIGKLREDCRMKFALDSWGYLEGCSTFRHGLLLSFLLA